ncbi:hypothetical protein TWF225_002315 [Orbilia oligospora]|nr:hypothetical protein TWF225_002315 [Orbilia oligospora]KAF3237088.1 hypothetical protein TWF217_002215 [Orbilia oligospora]KAF3256722.1 hypothetical protein TWF128_005231 [Orbilia oligospora]KAF3276951.1 hypothetical protein TWF132_001816 [Orbilia oligospora]
MDPKVFPYIFPRKFNQLRARSSRPPFRKESGTSKLIMEPRIGIGMRATAYAASILTFTSTVLASAKLDFGEVIRGDDKGLDAGIKIHISPQRRKLVLIHSAFAAVAWLFFAPVAIIIARFFKTARTGRGRIWFRLHFTIQMGTVIFMVLTFILGYYAVQPGSKYQFKNPHFQIGAAVFAAVLAQALLGIVNHFMLRPLRVRRNIQDPLKTPFSNKLHIILGWATLGLGLANIPIGMVLYGTHGRFLILFGVYVFGIILVILVLEAVRGRDRGVILEKEEERGRARRRGSSSTESVLPVAGAEIQEFIYIPLEDELETRTERMHTAPEIPVMSVEQPGAAQPTTTAEAQAAGYPANSAVKETPIEQPTAKESAHGDPVLVLRETSSEQPTLKETATGHPVEVPVMERPAGEAGEQAAVVTEPKSEDTKSKLKAGPIRV